MHSKSVHFIVKNWNGNLYCLQIIQLCSYASYKDVFQRDNWFYIMIVSIYEIQLASNLFVADSYNWDGGHQTLSDLMLLYTQVVDQS